jgi:hypothetical protein
MMHQPPPDSLPPRARLDKERVQINVSVVPHLNCREADECISLLRDENVPVLELLSGNVDGVRVRQYRVAVSGIRQRCTPLQRL